MPFSSAQMKALCLQAQPWTLRITLKAFCGCTGCVQCCGWGLYNLAALGNYKDKWREAQSITHPVREGGLRLGNFVFSKAAPTTPSPDGFLVSHSLFLLLAGILFWSKNLCCIFLHLLSVYSPLPPLSVFLTHPLSLPILSYWSRGIEVFIYTSSAAQIALLPLCQCILNEIKE